MPVDLQGHHRTIGRCLNLDASGLRKGHRKIGIVAIPRFDRKVFAVYVVVAFAVHHPEKVTRRGLDIRHRLVIEIDADDRLSA
jgi:hypothetical protein